MSTTPRQAQSSSCCRRLIDATTEKDIEITADKGYQGAGGTVRTPIKAPKGKGNNGWERLANSAHAKLRSAAERPLAALKKCRVLNILRISPNRATNVLHALFALIQKRSSLAKA